MKSCNKCGTLLDDEAMFCSECGSEIENVTEETEYENQAEAGTSKRSKSVVINIIIMIFLVLMVLTITIVCENSADDELTNATSVNEHESDSVSYSEQTHESETNSPPPSSSNRSTYYVPKSYDEIDVALIETLSDDAQKAVWEYVDNEYDKNVKVKSVNYLDSCLLVNSKEAELIILCDVKCENVNGVNYAVCMPVPYKNVIKTSAGYSYENRGEILGNSEETVDGYTYSSKGYYYLSDFLEEVSDRSNRKLYISKGGMLEKYIKASNASAAYKKYMEEYGYSMLRPAQ